jgi:thiol-disulfide isomerase/thioredoxin
MFNSKKKSEHDSFEVNDLKRAHGEVTFSNEPVDEYKPKANEITDVKSDKTVFEILSGAHGPTVVLFYADWCVHCNNMMPA